MNILGMCEYCANRSSKMECISNGVTGTVDHCKKQNPYMEGDRRVQHKRVDMYMDCMVVYWPVVCKDFKANLWGRIFGHPNNEV